MKHAGPSALLQLESLLGEVRSLGAFREPRPGTFYRGSAAFLHFHEDPAGLFADVKLDGTGFERFPVSLPEEQAALLGAIKAALGSARSVDASGYPK
jgi:hypothetical protein